jgi:hypothetical protein
MAPIEKSDGYLLQTAQVFSLGHLHGPQMAVTVSKIGFSINQSLQRQNSAETSSNAQSFKKKFL